MIRAGLLRTPVVVQKPRAAAGADAFNAVDLTEPSNWIDLYMRRAQVSPIAGREFLMSGQVAGETTHLVRMRHDPETRSITPNHRLRIGDGVSARYLNINRIVNVDERSAVLELQCIEAIN